MEQERTYQTVDQFTEQYLREHPDEMDDFVRELFEEYAQDGDLASLLATLRLVCRVKGVSFIAESAGLSRKGVQKALSEGGNPSFESLANILKSMGYALIPKKI